MASFRKRFVAATYSLVAGTILSLSFPADCFAETVRAAAPQATGAGLNFKQTPADAQVVELLSAGKNAEAKQYLLDAIKGKKSAEVAPDIYYLLALTEFNAGEYKDAAEDLKRVLASSASSTDARDRVLLNKRIGDCYFNLRDLEKALESYKSALAAASKLPPNDALFVRLNEAILACLVADEEYAAALPYGKQLLAVTQARVSSGTREDLADRLWAYLEEIDLLRRMGKEKDAERMALRNEASTLLEQMLITRSKAEASGGLPTLDDVKAAFLERCVSENKPSSVAEYLWLTAEFKLRTMPLIAWFPEERPKAAIICIHGLGLENRAFTAFGQSMAKRGYLVFAMDVRGFGSWQSTPGQEEVQFEYALADVDGIANLIKSRNPLLPVFLVGESMGGGIALQAGAQLGSTIAGIISSVPSPQRYEEGKASVSVAVHFLKGKDKSFDIGTMVANKATSDPAARKQWAADPKAKMEMTPRELMQFDKFMRQTEKQCTKITSTPVFIVQGTKDKLVKPGGSQELFDAVSGDDKSLLILGNAEHLIFETSHPSTILLEALSGWMNSHIPQQ